jgi:hypothetical protein
MASDNPLHPIPHPPRKLLVGNMLSVSASAPVQDLMQMSRQLGPIFWLDMMGKPMVVPIARPTPMLQRIVISRSGMRGWNPEEASGETVVIGGPRT